MQVYYMPSMLDVDTREYPQMQPLIDAVRPYEDAAVRTLELLGRRPLKQVKDHWYSRKKTVVDPWPLVTVMAEVYPSSMGPFSLPLWQLAEYAFFVGDHFS